MNLGFKGSIISKMVSVTCHLLRRVKFRIAVAHARCAFTARVALVRLLPLPRSRLWPTARFGVRVS